MVYFNPEKPLSEEEIEAASKELKKDRAPGRVEEKVGTPLKWFEKPSPAEQQKADVDNETLKDSTRKPEKPA